MRFENETEAITYVFNSLASTDWRNRGLDEHTRDLKPTQTLLEHTGLLRTSRREYAVVTGSKGKGSVAAFTARLLQSLGHTVGLVTSPHLTTYRQRFRVNGRMISEADLVRLISELSPAIDAVQADLPAGKYLSPQGIFLAVALRWFDEMNVNAAVIEVGRGGRFDDNALVPNMLSLFTPMVLEHTRYLGPSLERIAWHKAGIIKPNSYAYSQPQEPVVMDILRAEADARGAQFEWLAPLDMMRYLGLDGDGMRVDAGRYGEVTLPLLGRYEIDNASLATWGAGNMHARLAPKPGQAALSHGSAAYVAAIRDGLERLFWPGRCHKLQDAPAVYIDGAVNVLSARRFLESVRDHLNAPVVTVLAVPQDRDYNAVYPLYAAVSDALILTESTRNITIHFPPAEVALAAARAHHHDVRHQPDIAAALDEARARAGSAGTVLLAVAQPAVGDVMALYGLDFEQI